MPNLDTKVFDTPQMRGLALDAMVSIVHTGRAESLNVAMAATVVCFEVARQRRGGPRSSAVDVSG